MKKVHIKAITTRLDYEDFEQMVEFYNKTDGETKGCRITTELYCELPDMDVTFETVKKHGENAVQILAEYSERLINREISNEDARKLRDLLVEKIKHQTKQINEITKKLENTEVNLCFTGAYSSGKSTLINALLGAPILPENIKSETAKMFIISSPCDNEPIKISFAINDKSASIVWDKNKKSFIYEDISESNIQRELQEEINKHENSPLHVQLLAILTKLNYCESLTSDIKLIYPISLDNNKVKFKIYDTPGTDSNHIEHKQILMNALSAQSQSILIFVVKPDGLEGSANNALLDYLKQAEQKSQTNIDISRSIFVVNKSETITNTERVQLQSCQIKYEDDDSFSISLSDKKLLFVSAVLGRVAHEIKNGIIKESDEGYADLEDGIFNVCREGRPKSFCYRQNVVGTSQLSTERLISESDVAFKTAVSNNDEPQMLWVGAGMYALESEIFKFGEKYASAVRAYAIIHSVERSLHALEREVRDIKGQNEKNAESIKKDIKELEKTIQGAIKSKYDNLNISDGEAIPFDVCQKLGVDSTYRKDKIIDPIFKCVDKLKKGTFKDQTKEKEKKKLEDTINDVMAEFSKKFVANRKNCLEDNRDKFMTHIKQTIEENGDISPEAKKAFMDIPAPKIESSKKSISVDHIYEEHISQKKFFFFWPRNIVDKAGLKKALEEQIGDVYDTKSDEFKQDYCTSLKSILDNVAALFIDKLEEYSIAMNSLIKDRNETMNLGSIIQETYEKLKNSQDELNKKVLGG